MGSAGPDDKGGLDLAAAYAVETPDDSRDLYARWATTYESGFITDNGYVYHLGVAGAFAGAAIDADGLSPEMLDQARAKSDEGGDPVYRHLHEGDLTATLDLPTSGYGAVVSCGTFTHGHVGPGAFDELHRIARPGALFAIGINPDHFTNLGFADRFADDVTAGRITEPVVHRVDTYETGDHAGQLSPVVVFRTF